MRAASRQGKALRTQCSLSQSDACGQAFPWDHMVVPHGSGFLACRAMQRQLMPHRRPASPAALSSRSATPSPPSSPTTRGARRQLQLSAAGRDARDPEAAPLVVREGRNPMGARPACPHRLPAAPQVQQHLHRLPLPGRPFLPALLPGAITLNDPFRWM